MPYRKRDANSPPQLSGGHCATNHCLDCRTPNRGVRCRRCHIRHLKATQHGAAHPNWHPTGRSTKGRYVAIRTRGGSNGWKHEHQLIAEQVLGRPLRRGEVVHHINGNPQDNRKCNLLICTQSYHALLHQRMAQAWAREHLGGV